jgi:acyl-CoA thioester hydrolase
VEADFHRVLVFEDEIDVRLWAEHVGETSIRWRFEITRDGELCVEGGMVVVHVDPEARAIPLTEPLRNLL